MTQPTFQIGQKHLGLKNPNGLVDDLDYSIWLDCEFTDCELSGVDISYATISKCVFDKTSLYWADGFKATFIDSKFIKCDLRGWFNEARFIRCSFVECEHGKDELGGSTEWENAIAIDCDVIGEPLPIVESTEN